MASAVETSCIIAGSVIFSMLSWTVDRLFVRG